MAEIGTTPAALCGGAVNAPHLAPNNFGPTRKSLKEEIQEDVVSTYNIGL